MISECGLSNRAVAWKFVFFYQRGFLGEKPALLAAGAWLVARSGTRWSRVGSAPGAAPHGRRDLRNSARASQLVINVQLPI